MADDRSHGAQLDAAHLLASDQGLLLMLPDVTIPAAVSRLGGVELPWSDDWIGEPDNRAVAVASTSGGVVVADPWLHLATAEEALRLLAGDTKCAGLGWTIDGDINVDLRDGAASTSLDLLEPEVIDVDTLPDGVRTTARRLADVESDREAAVDIIARHLGWPDWRDWDADDVRLVEVPGLVGQLVSSLSELLDLQLPTARMAQLATGATPDACWAVACDVVKAMFTAVGIDQVIPMPSALFDPAAARPAPWPVSYERALRRFTRNRRMRRMRAMWAAQYLCQDDPVLAVLGTADQRFLLDPYDDEPVPPELRALEDRLAAAQRPDQS